MRTRRDYRKSKWLKTAEWPDEMLFEDNMQAAAAHDYTRLFRPDSQARSFCGNCAMTWGIIRTGGDADEDKVKPDSADTR